MSPPNGTRERDYLDGDRPRRSQRASPRRTPSSPWCSTSSTRTTRPRTGFARKAPRTFRRRSSRARPRWRRSGRVRPSTGSTGSSQPPPELAGEARGRVVAAREAPLAVGRHERDQLSGRPWHDLDHEPGGERGEAAQPALLPGGDERADARVVRDRGPGGGERDPPARALAAARDRPGDGRTAAGAQRRGEPWQRARAGRADGGAREASRRRSGAAAAGRAAHGDTVGGIGARVCHGSATKV